MPEEISVNRNVTRAFLSGRTGRSALDELSALLDTTAEVGVQVGKIAQEKEVRQVEEALSSETITEEEIAEIRENAFFPAAKVKARNRMGAAMVTSARENIDLALEAATDPIEAREILRTQQALLLDGTDNADVRAGIREAMNDISRPALADAAALRKANNQREEELNTFSAQSHALINGDAEGYVERFKIQQTEEGLVDDSRKMPDFVKKSAQTLLSVYSEDRLAAIDVIEAAEAMKRDKSLLPAERKVFGEVADTVRKSEADLDSGLTDTQARKQRKVAARHAFHTFVEENPGVTVPIEVFENVIDTADDPLEAEKWIEDTNEQLNPTVGKSKLVPRGQKILNTFYKRDDVSGQFDPAHAEQRRTMDRMYNQIMQSAPSEILQLPPAEQEKWLSDTVDKIPALYEKEKQLQKETDEALKEEQDGTYQLMKDMEEMYLALPPEDGQAFALEARRLNQQLKHPKWVSRRRKLYLRELLETADELGVELNPINLLSY